MLGAMDLDLKHMNHSPRKPGGLGHKAYMTDTHRSALNYQQQNKEFQDKIMLNKTMLGYTNIPYSPQSLKSSLGKGVTGMSSQIMIQEQKAKREADRLEKMQKVKQQ